MKLLFIFLLLPFFSIGQDSTVVCQLKKSSDPFTHVNKLSTGFKNFDGGGKRISITADASPTEIDFFIWVKGEGNCFDAESTALLVFEGERSKTTLRNSGSINCDGAFHFTFKNTPNTHSWLRRLGEKKLSSIKLSGNNTEVNLELSEEQKENFRQMASCVASEGKSLIKR